MSLKPGLRIYRFLAAFYARTLNTPQVVPQPRRSFVMSSLWKDLLFLHGHMTQASLIWSDVDTATDRDDATAKKATPHAQTCAAACCVVAGLPRIVAPR
jgi:hypothetical protein